MAGCPSEGIQALLADTTPLTAAEVAVFKCDFDGFDIDLDTFLNADEIKGLLRHQLGREPTDIESKAMMLMFDTDQDNRISFSEYMEHVVGDAWKGYNTVTEIVPVGKPKESNPDADDLEKIARDKAAIAIQKSARARSAKKQVTAKKESVKLNKAGRARKKADLKEARLQAKAEAAADDAAIAKATQDRIDAARKKQAETKAEMQAQVEKNLQ